MISETYCRDEVLLDIRDVRQSYGTKEVLSGVNVQIRNVKCTSNSSMIAGQVIAFLGPSGSGKTQLLRIAAGLQEPTSGNVYIDPDAKPIRRGMAGVVFQKYPLFEHRTVIGNLELAGELAGMNTKAAHQHAMELLTLFELDGEARRYPAELSGGMKQRVAISQQLMSLDGNSETHTRLMFMDEPFAALDHRNTQKTCKLIRQVADMNDTNTIIVVTHDISAALAIADVLWVMGRDRDAEGKVCSGGKIVREYDLISAGLTWHPKIDTLPQFANLRRELSELFYTL